MVQVHNVSTGQAITGERGGFFKAPDAIKIRELRANVSLDQVRKAISNNNLDEVVFQDPAGKRFVMYADELKGKVNVGDAVVVDGVRGRVTMVDDEWNEDTIKHTGILVGAVAAGVAIAAGGLFASGIIAGTDGRAAIGGAGSVALGTAAVRGALSKAFRESDNGIRMVSTPEVSRPRPVSRD